MNTSNRVGTGVTPGPYPIFAQCVGMVKWLVSSRIPLGQR